MIIWFDNDMIFADPFYIFWRQIKHEIKMDLNGEGVGLTQCKIYTPARQRTNYIPLFNFEWLISPDHWYPAQVEHNLILLILPCNQYF